MQNAKHIQTQLELARTLTAGKVQQLVNAHHTDPVSRQILEQMQHTLTRIEGAQARISTGQYGRCEICRQPIEPERLEIFPYTEHCAACQRATERKVLRGTRQTNHPSIIERRL